MKISNKLIIVLIVAAVAAYLLWKKGAIGKNSTESSSSTATVEEDAPIEPAGLTATQIIDRLTACPAEHKKYLRSYVSKIEADDNLKRSVQEKATNNGIPFAKQAVMDASWVTYRTGANANAGWAKDMHERICAQVQSM